MPPKIFSKATYAEATWSCFLEILKCLEENAKMALSFFPVVTFLVTKSTQKCIPIFLVKLYMQAIQKGYAFASSAMQPMYCLLT